MEYPFVVVVNGATKILVASDAALELEGAHIELKAGQVTHCGKVFAKEVISDQNDVVGKAVGTQSVLKLKTYWARTSCSRPKEQALWAAWRIVFLR